MATDTAMAVLALSCPCINLSKCFLIATGFEGTSSWEKRIYSGINLSVLVTSSNVNIPFVPTIDLGEKGVKQFNILKKDAPEENAIKEELKSFIESIKDNNNPVVDLYAAQQALSIATEIATKINSNIFQ